MMFERDEHGAFRDIDCYLPNALVTFNTHDLATYAGWRHFRDLKLKRSLGFDPGETDDDRWHALAMLDQVLASTAFTTTASTPSPNSWRAPKSRLMAVALEDLLGLQDSPTFPAPSTSIRTGGAACRSASTRCSRGVDSSRAERLRPVSGARERGQGALTVNWIPCRSKITARSATV
jgi:hypothetical protein